MGASRDAWFFVCAIVVAVVSVADAGTKVKTFNIMSDKKVTDNADLLPDAVVPQTCQTVCLFTPTCNGYQLSADRTVCNLIGNANAVLTAATGWTVYKN